jgi:thioredoxin 1
MVAHTTDASFEQDVVKSDVPVLVDFWAPWCGPCRIVGPILEQVAEANEGKVKVYKLNVDENPAIANQFGITGIPTVIIFRDGKAVKQLVGAQPAQVYMNAVAA